MNDLKLIKQEIIEKDLIIPLLESVGCDNVRKNRNLIQGSRPEGDNPAGFSIRLDDENELPSKVWTRNVYTRDIFDLISYFKFGKENETEIKNCLPKSKRYIIDTLKLKTYKELANKEDPNAWLKEIEKKRSKQIILSEIEPNSVLPESVLKQFIPYPHVKWLDEFQYETLLEFEIGFDVPSERIVIPIRNRHGQLVGIKGRRTKSDDDSKYLYLYPFEKHKEWFNLHRSLTFIQKQNEVILVEAEKSCFKLYEYGYFNTVSQMGSDIHTIQSEILKRINPDLKIIIAMDKDKSVDDIKHTLKSFTGYANLWGIYDTKGLLEGKDSPVDKGKETWEILYKNHCYPIKL